MKMCVMGCFLKSKKKKLCLSLIAGILMADAQVARAQNGTQAITDATGAVVSYFDVGINLMYAIGAVVGLIGAIRVYQKWSHGDHDTSKVAASWFGSCIFLVIVATALKTFFNVT